MDAATSEDASGVPCAGDAADECGPYSCVDGRCASDCAIGPCADGHYCRGDTLTCVPDCTRRGDPRCDGYLCELDVRECESYCREGELACAPGYRCNPEDRCMVDDAAPDCSAGCGAYACLEHLGRCATRCIEDADCAAGATCAGGVCG